MKIKKGDTVVIVKGKDRKKTGKISRALPQENKIVIEGLNLYKKHKRAKSGRAGEKGEIVLIARPIPASNVKLICPHCQKATRVGYKVNDGVKQRMCKTCNATL